MPLRALLLCAALLLLPPVLGRGLASARDTVLVVHSYNPEYIWTQQINQGLREALRGLEVELEFFYMDAKRGPDPERLGLMLPFTLIESARVVVQ